MTLRTYNKPAFLGGNGAIYGAIAGAHVPVRQPNQNTALPAQPLPVQSYLLSPGDFLNICPPRIANKPSALKFGFDPSPALIWLVQTSGGSLVGKGIDFILSSDHSEESKEEKSALEFLKLAKNSTLEVDKKDYLRKAESNFVKYAASAKEPLKKATAYKEAAITAHMLGRNSGAVQTHIDNAVTSLRKYETEVEEMAQSAHDRLGTLMPTPSDHEPELRYNKEIIKLNSDGYNIWSVAAYLHSTSFVDQKRKTLKRTMDNQQVAYWEKHVDDFCRIM